MKEITVNTDRAYRVLIGRGLYREAASRFREAGISGKLLIVSDDNVAPLYLSRIQAELKAGGFETYAHVFRHGERNKTLKTYEGVLEALAKNTFSRTDCVVALGGGVVGDVAGFAAASYMRGIAYVQLPTTLLAGIDSSVGGKTGVDLKEGKNLVGAFHQPRLVLFDLDTLKTLPPDRFWKDGMGEGIKYAVLEGGEIYDLLAKGKRAFSEEELERFVALSVDCKRRIVEADEKEGGQRRLLNLGHTLGHALEKRSGYKLHHGAAVAEGIYRITDLAQKRGLIENGEAKKIFRLLKGIGFSRRRGDTDELIPFLSLDKKGADGGVYLVLPRAIGRVEMQKVPYAELEGFFRGE